MEIVMEFVHRTPCYISVNSNFVASLCFLVMSFLSIRTEESD